MLKLYALHDKTARVFNAPFPERADELVIRALRAAVNNPAEGNNLYAYPKDYAVYHIADYNGDTGEITPQTPRLVVECATLVTPKDS